MALVGYIYPGEMFLEYGGDGVTVLQWDCNITGSPIPVYSTGSEAGSSHISIYFFHTSFPTFGYIPMDILGVRHNYDPVSLHPNYWDNILGYTNCPVFAIRHNTTIYDTQGYKKTDIPAGYHVALTPGNQMNAGQQSSHWGWMSIDFYNIGSGWQRFDGFIDAMPNTYGLGSNAVLDYGLN
ncbi:hypothetical protein [Alicyclobacillus macrosporangiidus]|uniref:Uncharacterized protein n=1 Tax=Alicyclobacillus macrosporangiidus TaxID=392015 RepID=A0A1I7FXG7_9BACL|nr:hypothetical protein [Alicyclobacillus macrosporangiidus]SFU40776.1 hypothetical protein SAMN05421543_101497 [Alicyclobacillus macrosporangiidus]